MKLTQVFTKRPEIGGHNLLFGIGMLPPSEVQQWLGKEQAIGPISSSNARNVRDSTNESTTIQCIYRLHTHVIPIWTMVSVRFRDHEPAGPDLCLGHRIYTPNPQDPTHLTPIILGHLHRLC